MSSWKAATKQNPGPVFNAHTSAKVPKLEQDCEQTVACKTAKVLTQKLHHHHYGPESQQDDITPTELL